MASKKQAAKKKTAPARKRPSKSKGSAAKTGTRKTAKGKPGEGSTGPKHIQWEMAKRLYITSSRYLTHEELLDHLKDRDGKKVECNVSVVHRRASKENWAQLRKEYIAGVTKQFLEVIGERYVLTRKASLDQLALVRETLVDAILAGKVEKVTVNDLLNAIKTETALLEGRDESLLVRFGVDREQASPGVEHVKKALLSALEKGKLTRQQLRDAVLKKSKAVT